MTHASTYRSIALSLALLVSWGCAPSESPLTEKTEGPKRTISAEDFEDKVRGGWAGQMIGVTYGGPTEFRWQQKIVDIDRQWKSKEIKDALDQDDLYVEMTFAGVMDRAGLGATTEQYGEAFRDSQYRLWHANLAARASCGVASRRRCRGIPITTCTPMTSTFKSSQTSSA